MNFSKLKSNTWLNNYSKWLPLVQWAGWIFVVLILAKIFWLWFDYFNAPTEFRPIKVKAVAASQSSAKININALTGLNLFGSTTKEAPKVKQPVRDAPETKLNLKLRGIYAADTQKKANAIIEDDRGKQAVYFIDEKLKVSGTVYLRHVYIDRVMLETNGRDEILKLEVGELLASAPKLGEKKSGTSGKKKNIDKRSNQKLSRELHRYRNKLIDDPKSVSDAISGRPHFVDGELRGFKIAPGKDRGLFRDLGLQRGDVVTSINGTPLTNMQEAMTLMNDAQSIKELDIEIQRNNESLNLLLNLNEKVGL